MLLPDGWYATVESSEVTRKKPFGFTRFGIALVAFRDSQGEVQVLEDRCPHRSAKLSLGKVKGDHVACPFHGFEYDGKGTCQCVPEIARAAPGLKTRAFHVQEKEGLVWVWMGGGEPNRALPWFADLDRSFAMSQTRATWGCHITRCIENQLDYAHLPFVHRNTIGRGFDVRIRPTFSVDESSIRMVLGAEKTSPYIEFRYPCLWMNHINDNFRVVALFSPIDEHRTEIYLRSYQRFLNVPVARSVMRVVLNVVNRIILKQDHGVVMSQRPDASTNAWGETLFLSDTAILEFRRWWKQ